MCKGIYLYSRHILVLALTTCKEKKIMPQERIKVVIAVKLKKKNKKKERRGQ